MKTLILCLLTLSFELALAFDDPPRSRRKLYSHYSGRAIGTLSIQIDQDFFADLINNQDRNYTQGTAFSYSQLGHEKENIIFTPLNLIYKLHDRLFILSRDNYFDFQELPAQIGFGVSAFTPLNIRTYIPEYGDRPYSNIVFLQTTRTRTFRRSVRSWSLVYGLLGTNVSQEFQSFAHSYWFTGRGIPLGWDTQISKGGHFAFLIQNSFKAPVRTFKFDEARKGELFKSDKWWKEWLRWDASYGLESAAGYYTYFSGNIGLRAGKINFANFGKGQNTILSAVDKKNEPGVINENPVVEDPIWEHFLYASLSPRLFARNALISGQKNIESGYALDSKYVNTFVAELEIGWTSSRTRRITQTNAETGVKKLLSLDSFQASISIKRRSPEIKYPGFRRPHYWGCVSVSVPFH